MQIYNRLLQKYDSHTVSLYNFTKSIILDHFEATVKF